MIEVAITYHEDFGARGFFRAQGEDQALIQLMQSGLVDGREVQVFRPKPAPLALVETCHTAAHMMNMKDDPYQEGKKINRCFQLHTLLRLRFSRYCFFAQY